MPGAIELDGLTKRFGALLAVDALTFDVPRGAVYGFLGPNGAGKTTTLGMLTGLVPPDAGTARIAGRDVRDDLSAALAGVGAMVEEPAFYPQLTGRGNLGVVARLVGAPRERVDETLARVGLAGAADQRYKGYSQGMRRRLGLAAALLPAPEVLLLDEPTNGLDPAGQREVQAILREHAARGGTVLLSSHLLHDVQAVCTHAAVLHRGRLVAAGAMGDLLAAEPRIVVEVDDLARARRALEGWDAVAVVGEDRGRLVVHAPIALAPEVNRRLVLAGVAVSGLSATTSGLEERFFEMTGGAT